MMKVANQVMYDIEFACIKFMGERTTTTFDDLRLDPIRNYVAKENNLYKFLLRLLKWKETLDNLFQPMKLIDLRLIE